VALDRQSIERNDFPVGENGYDPAAVAAHLTALADELDEFKQAARRRTETLASSASEQVRSIVQAAETSAADIQRAAEEEAHEIKADADREAQSIRQQASEETRESFGKVSESTSAMLQRLDSMESELNALIESLRTGSGKLNADLELLVSEVGASVEGPAPFHRDAGAAPQSEHEQADEELTYGTSSDEDFEVPEQGQEGHGQATEQNLDAGWGEPTPEHSDGGFEPAAAASGDTEGARLIALNMALNGTPREETARYLAANFDLPDHDGLLDEVYSSIED
jgi:cell division septum initiation protein DivIVA